MSKLTMKEVSKPNQNKLNKLRVKKAKLLQALSDNKNKLAEFKRTVKEAIQHGTQKQAFDVMENVVKKHCREIIELLDEILKTKKLNKKQKNKVVEMKELMIVSIKEIEEEFLREMDSFTAMMKEMADELKQTKQAELFDDSDFNQMPSLDKELEKFAIEANEEEKKDIRALYLEIIKQFHPDKFQGSEKEKKYHTLTQQANLAYQINDYDALISLKEKFLVNDFQGNDFLQTKNTDELPKLQEREIVLLEKELSILESQLQRVKEELAKLKKSEFGYLYKDFQKMDKATSKDILSLENELKPMKDELINFLNGEGDFPESLINRELGIIAEEDDDLLVTNQLFHEIDLSPEDIEKFFAFLNKNTNKPSPAIIQQKSTTTKKSSKKPNSRKPNSRR